MKTKKVLLAFFLGFTSLVATQVLAAEYPKDIQGAWTTKNPMTCAKDVKSKNDPSVLRISKGDQTKGGVFCNASKVSGRDGTYQILNDECGDDSGYIGELNLKYKREGDVLTVDWGGDIAWKGKGRLVKYQKCLDMK